MVCTEWYSTTWYGVCMHPVGQGSGGMVEVSSEQREWGAATVAACAHLPPLAAHAIVAQLIGEAAGRYMRLLRP